MEYKIRRLQQLLGKALRSEQEARLRASITPDSYSYVTKDMKARAEWWADEVVRLEGELLSVLSGLGDEELDASQAAAVLARSRRE